MKSARAAVFSSDLTITRCSARMVHFSSHRKALPATEKTGLLMGASFFLLNASRKHQQKANRVLQHRLIEQLKQINVHLPS